MTLPMIIVNIVSLWGGILAFPWAGPVLVIGSAMFLFSMLVKKARTGKY